MDGLILILILSCSSGVVLGGEPVVNCPAPRSPDNGQAFLYHDGSVVKVVCEPGFILHGKETVRCVDGVWEDSLPVCLEYFASDEAEVMSSLSVPEAPGRPLFNWGSEVKGGEEEDEKNATSDGDEMPMSDGTHLRMVLVPRRRLVSSRTRVARVSSASELEDEERKRAKETTVVQVRGPPSFISVQRTGKSNAQDKPASVHMAVENVDDRVQVVSLPRAAVAQNDKGEDALRHMYWMAQYYHHPRQASVVEYRSGNQAAVLSESQIQWINSLHPELRDQYLRDLYVVRADGAVEGARAQAFLRRYEDVYHPYYYPYYYRQPLAAVTEDLTSVYDYSCNQAGYNFVRGRKLSHAHIARYDRRQNPNEPRNHYLAAIYRCNPGYVMLDTRFTELYCSRRSWIGTEPICVPRS